MPISKRVEAYLKKANKKFDVLSHKTVYTAYDVAQTLKRSLKEIGKTLLVKADKAYVLVVVPASARIDFKKLKKALRAKNVAMVPEKVMVKVLKVKPGALTAFGGLHKLEIIADRGLNKTKEIILQAGSFTDSVRMEVKDFLAMEQAKLASISGAAGYIAPKAKAKKAKRR